MAQISMRALTTPLEGSSQRGKWVIGHEFSGEVESVGEGGRSGISEIELRALENVQVGAAHAGAPQADQRGSRRDFRLGPLDERQLVRAGAEPGSHRSPVA
jgi:hypothetical protein